jgi:hypothetical protein
MSAHTARPGSRPRHPARPAIWAAAAAVALLTAACTSTASTTGPDTAASVVAGAHAPTLTGPGRRSTRRSSPWPSPGISSSIAV